MDSNFKHNSGTALHSIYFSHKTLETSPEFIRGHLISVEFVLHHCVSLVCWLRCLNRCVHGVAFVLIFFVCSASLQIMSRKNSSRSIDLSKSQKQDESGFDEEDEDPNEDNGDTNEEEANEGNPFNVKGSANTWAEGGPKKEHVIGKLIKYFGSMVVKAEGEDDVWVKAPNASINIVRARM
jgi:hypothetical protein